MKTLTRFLFATAFVLVCVGLVAQPPVVPSLSTGAEGFYLFPNDHATNPTQGIVLGDVGAPQTALGAITIGYLADADLFGDQSVVIGRSSYSYNSYNTCVGSFTRCENGIRQTVLGYGAEGHTNNTVAVGYNANSTGTASSGGLFLGYNTQPSPTSHTGVIAVGDSARASTQAIALGVSASAVDTGNISIGYFANTPSGSTYSIAIGHGAQTTAAGDYSIALGRAAYNPLPNTMVVGQQSYPVNNYYWGMGMSATIVGSDVGFYLTPESGADQINNKDWIFTGAQGTGNQPGGDIIFRAPVAGVSSATVNVGEDALTVDGATATTRLSLPYGEMYASESSTTLTLTAATTWYQWVDVTCGENDGMTCSATTDDLIVDAEQGGVYSCSWHMGFTSNTNNQVIRATLAIDDVVQGKCGNHRKASTGADVGSTGGSCKLRLAAAEAITLEIYNETSAGVIVTPIHVNVGCQRIGN